MASAKKDAVVIGAGFAGLSAAVALAERGVRVTVLEGKPAPGGRAYSFADPDTGDFVDNGQHVLMGCYGETLDFLKRIGAYDQLVFHEDLEIEMLAGPGQSAILKTARLPGPLHMTAALLGYRHLSIAERIARYARRTAHARDETVRRRRIAPSHRRAADGSASGNQNKRAGASGTRCRSRR